MNANDFFANRAGLKKGDYLSNQFGFTAGGPAITNKTFWFADYEGSLIKQARTWVTTVPTAAQRASGFTNYLGPHHAAEREPSAPTSSAERSRAARSSIRRRRGSVTAGQVDPVTGLVATTTGFVRDPFADNTHSRRAGSTPTPLS